MIVGTLGTIYGIEGDGELERSAGGLTRRPEPAGAVALLVFSRSPCSVFPPSLWSPGDRRLEVADLSIQLYAGPGVQLAWLAYRVTGLFLH